MHSLPRYFSSVCGRKLWKVNYSVGAALIAMCYSACECERPCTGW